MQNGQKGSSVYEIYTSEDGLILEGVMQVTSFITVIQSDIQFLVLYLYNWWIYLYLAFISFGKNKHIIGEIKLQNMIDDFSFI